MVKELNEKVLGQIADKNDTSEAVFALLASRERSRSETDLRRLKLALVHEGFKIIPQDFVATFKELASAGIGEFVSIPGQQPKFRWHFNMKDVGKTALGDSTAAKLKAMPQATKPATKAVVVQQKVAEDPAPKAVSPRTTMIVCTNGREATMDLPPDLSAEEAKFLADAIMRQVKR